MTKLLHNDVRYKLIVKNHCKCRLSQFLRQMKGVLSLTDYRLVRAHLIKRGVPDLSQDEGHYLRERLIRAALTIRLALPNLEGTILLRRVDEVIGKAHCATGCSGLPAMA